MDGIRCDKLSTAVATVRAHQDKYKKDFYTVVIFLTQILTTRQKTSTTHGSLKGKIELKKYSREEYNSMSMAQHQQLHKLRKRPNLIKDKKTAESSRASEARVAVLEAKTGNSSNESLFPDEKPKANNRNNLAIDRKESGTRESSYKSYP